MQEIKLYKWSENNESKTVKAAGSYTYDLRFIIKSLIYGNVKKKDKLILINL